MIYEFIKTASSKAQTAAVCSKAPSENQTAQRPEQQLSQKPKVGVG